MCRNVIGLFTILITFALLCGLIAKPFLSSTIQSLHKFFIQNKCIEISTVIAIKFLSYAENVFSLPSLDAPRYQQGLLVGHKALRCVVKCSSMQADNGT